jgi:hypothetical protein
MNTAGINLLTAAVAADSDLDFTADSHTLFALSISRLSPAQRENVLKDVESTLRDEVGLFDVACPSPYPRSPQANGRGH